MNKLLQLVILSDACKKRLDSLMAEIGDYVDKDDSENIKRVIPKLEAAAENFETTLNSLEEEKKENSSKIDSALEEALTFGKNSVRVVRELVKFVKIEYDL